jgi:hypothetical protein
MSIDSQTPYLDIDFLPAFLLWLLQLPVSLFRRLHAHRRYIYLLSYQNTLAHLRVQANHHHHADGGTLRQFSTPAATLIVSATHQFSVIFSQSIGNFGWQTTAQYSST